MYLVVAPAEGAAAPGPTPGGTPPPAVAVDALSGEAAAESLLLVRLRMLFYSRGAHRREEAPPEVSGPRGTCNKRRRGRDSCDAFFYRVRNGTVPSMGQMDAVNRCDLFQIGTYFFGCDTESVLQNGRNSEVFRTIFHESSGNDFSQTESGL